MEKILIEYVCLTLEYIEHNFDWNSLEDDEVEAF